jgi:8-oxo-dGTP pyrophosphatase MutT (NUDIX family)
VDRRFRRLRRLLRKVGLWPRPTRKEPKRRAVAVVLDGDQVLVMRRAKRGREYAVLPGGAVEEGETPAEAALRELHEETTLLAEIDRLLWTGWHNDRPAWYFLMTAVRGDAELSGPEALSNGPDNRYELRWVTADQFTELGLHPSDIRGPLTDLLTRRPGTDEGTSGGPEQRSREPGRRDEDGGHRHHGAVVQGTDQRGD